MTSTNFLACECSDVKSPMPPRPAAPPLLAGGVLRVRLPLPACCCGGQVLKGTRAQRPGYHALVRRRRAGHCRTTAGRTHIRTLCVYRGRGNAHAGSLLRRVRSTLARTNQNVQAQQLPGVQQHHKNQVGEGHGESRGRGVVVTNRARIVASPLLGSPKSRVHRWPPLAVRALLPLVLDDLLRHGHDALDAARRLLKELRNDDLRSASERGDGVRVTGRHTQGAALSLHTGEPPPQRSVRCGSP